MGTRAARPGRRGRGERATGAAEPRAGFVGNTGERGAQRVRIRMWLQEACLPATLLGRSSLRRESLPSLLCVLSEAYSLLPALTIQLPVHSLPGINPPEGLQLLHPSGACGLPFTLSFPNVGRSVALIAKTLLGLPKGGAAGSLQPLFLAHSS